MSVYAGMMILTGLSMVAVSPKLLEHFRVSKGHYQSQSTKVEWRGLGW